MNSKIKNKIKLIYIILVLFVLINIIIQIPVLAASKPTNTAIVGPKTKLGATVLEIVLGTTQIAVSGFFIIKLTIVGIQYFTAVGAGEKVEQKNRIKWTLMYVVLAFIALYLFSLVVGL